MAGGWPPNFFMTTKNIKRPSVANDAYFTPDWVVQLALREIVPLICPVPASILEPGAGKGAFVTALRARYPEVFIMAVDIEPYAWPEADMAHHGDFLTMDLQRHYDLAIGNPPFSQAMPFITRCLGVSRTTVLLLRQGFLSSAKRNTFFRMHPPGDVFILPNRPSFDGLNSDSSDYCFVCWGRAGGTRLHWLSTVPLAQRR